MNDSPTFSTFNVTGCFAFGTYRCKYRSPGGHVGQQLGWNDRFDDGSLLIKNEHVGGGIHLRERIVRLQRQEPDIFKPELSDGFLQRSTFFSLTDQEPQDIVQILGQLRSSHYIHQVLLPSHVSCVHDQKLLFCDLVRLTELRGCRDWVDFFCVAPKRNQLKPVRRNPAPSQFLYKSIADTNHPVGLPITKSLDRPRHSNGKSILQDAGGQGGVRGKICKYDNVRLPIDFREQIGSQGHCRRRANTANHIEPAV